MEDTVVFTWGRMNPPTTGHELLVNKVRAIARLEGADCMVYLSHSQDSKKNPFDYNTKVKYVQKAFGKVVQRSTCNTVLKVLEELDKKYDKVIMVVGADRIEEFKTLLNKYNGKNYHFSEIKVVSAGDRDAAASDVSGMSASKMRKLATDEDFESFKSGLPSMLRSVAKRVYDDLRKAMGI